MSEMKITFHGFAVKKQGKYLRFKPKSGKQYYKKPRFPCVSGIGYAQFEAEVHRGEVVKVRLTMKELARVLIALQQFATACEEVQHYLEEGNDYFSVSVGPWEIKYSEIEEGEKE